MSEKAYHQVARLQQVTVSTHFWAPVQSPNWTDNKEQQVQKVLPIYAGLHCCCAKQG